MANSEERENIAAEYVLGTLDQDERLWVESQMKADPSFCRLVESWEARLSPLALVLEPVPVPDGLRQRVMAAAGADQDGKGRVIDFAVRARRWRSVAIAGWAIAAGVAGFMLINPALVPPPGHFVAVLESEGPGPAFIATVDIGRGTIAVRAVSAIAQPAKSYELWAVGAGRDKPQSLGVINADFKVPVELLGTRDKAVLDQTVFAVSLEPEGGSPTGQPTGPVLFTGKLVATE